MIDVIVFFAIAEVSESWGVGLAGAVAVHLVMKPLRRSAWRMMQEAKRR